MANIEGLKAFRLKFEGEYYLPLNFERSCSNSDCSAHVVERLPFFVVSAVYNFIHMLTKPFIDTEGEYSAICQQMNAAATRTVAITRSESDLACRQHTWFNVCPFLS